MWLRFRDWRLISDQEQVKMAEVGNRRYGFWKRDEGLCEVKILKDVEEILYRKNSPVLQFELAYEKHGIEWDKTGVERERETVPVLSSSNGESHVSLSEAPMTETTGNQLSEVQGPVVVQRQKLTPAECVERMREARNRKRIAAGKQPIEFKA